MGNTSKQNTRAFYLSEMFRYLVEWAILRQSFLRGAQLFIRSGSADWLTSGNWFITLRKDLDKIRMSFAVCHSLIPSTNKKVPPTNKKEAQILMGLFKHSSHLSVLLRPIYEATQKVASI